MPLAKRVRGWLVRLVLKRTSAIMLGLLLVTPAAWLLAGDFSWESSATDGIGLILGATGTALFLAGIGGRRPDWID